MAEPNLLEVITWLDARRRPILVQVPRSEYVRVKAAWQLPGEARPRPPSM
jgi:hypothetical protein